MPAIMKISILLILVTASTATFQKIKPKKLYKHLVEPLVGAALKDVFAGSLFNPLGLFFENSKKQKHHKGNHKKYPAYHQQYAPFYHNGPDYLYEKNIFYQQGGGHPYGYGVAGHHYGNGHHYSYGDDYGNRYGDPSYHYDGLHQELHPFYPEYDGVHHHGLYGDLDSEFL